MRKIVALTGLAGLALAVALAGVAFAGAEKPITVRAGNLLLTVNGNASPTRLPKHGLAPISFHASGRIATADGSHPPAVTDGTLDAGKAGTIEADEFPSCPQGRLEATTTEQAEERCPGAIVGRGRTTVEVQFPESAPFEATGPLVLFNGGEKNGKALLFIHAYVNVPVPTAVVTSVVTERIHVGPYRLHSLIDVPPIAGGAGSVIRFALKIDRKGYLTANCDNGHFSARFTAGFSDGTDLAGAFQRPCVGIG
jgi:hypothetical protein